MNIRYVDYGADDEQAEEYPVQSAGNRSAEIDSPVGSPWVKMHLDTGLLPIRLEFSSSWAFEISSHEVDRELTKSYEGAVLDVLIRTFKVHGGRPDRPLAHANRIPTLREQICLLLQTETWEQYQQTAKSLRTFGKYVTHGPTMTQDEPVFTMTADRIQVRSFRTWPIWQGSLDPLSLEREVLACAQQIRQLRPEIVLNSEFSQYSDRHLDEMHQEHRLRLSRH